MLTDADVKDLENRFTYHAPKGDQQERYQELRKHFLQLGKKIFDLCPHSRERSVAMTELESAAMWANASIARNE